MADVPDGAFAQIHRLSDIEGFFDAYLSLRHGRLRYFIQKRHIGRDLHILQVSKPFPVFKTDACCIHTFFLQKSS